VDQATKQRSLFVTIRLPWLLADITRIDSSYRGTPINKHHLFVYYFIY